MSHDDIMKLKVERLKKALCSRDLSHRGKKAELVERLKMAKSILHRSYKDIERITLI